MGVIELVGFVLVTVAGAFFFGKSKGKQDEKRKQDQDYIDARKRMDEVSVDSDVGVVRDWLHERGRK